MSYHNKTIYYEAVSCNYLLLPLGPCTNEMDCIDQTPGFVGFETARPNDLTSICVPKKKKKKDKDVNIIYKKKLGVLIALIYLKSHIHNIF